MFFFFFLKTCPFDMFVIWISTVLSGWGGGGGEGSKACHYPVAIFYSIKRWLRSGRLKPLEPYSFSRLVPFCAMTLVL